MRYFIFLWFGLLFSCSDTSTTTNTAKVEDTRPNILYIMLDDLGFSDLGCYGSEIAKQYKKDVGVIFLEKLD